MDRSFLTKVLDTASTLGVDYGEARLQRNREMDVLLRDGKPEPPVSTDAFGLAVRVIDDGCMGFASTNRLQWEEVERCTISAIRVARASRGKVSNRIGMSDEKMGRGRWQPDERRLIDEAEPSALLQSLEELDRLIKDGFHGIEFPHRLLYYTTSLEEKWYVNTEGADLESRVPRALFRSSVTSKLDGRFRTFTIPPGYAQDGGSGGLEVLDGLSLHERLPERAREIAEVVRNAKSMNRETCSVVLGPEVSGLVAHESCGHPGEADRVLGREAAQAGESYLKPSDVGLKIGSPEANVSDDPTLPGSMGFYLYDDEGVRAGKRRLISEGHISSLFHNRSTAHQMNVNSNASSRAVSFGVEPIVRMANTYVEPGDWSMGELLKEAGNGVYIKSFMEWNIDDKRLNQRYVGLEAYRVSGGELIEPLLDVVLELTTPKFWSSVVARGDTVQHTAAVCGKGDPMQGCPVWTGGPHVLLKGVEVFSR